LIQRDEATAQPVLFYSKLPPLAGKTIVLVDPMLATGGSAICAIKVLVDAGADPRNLTFLTVLSCPEGLTNVNKAYPGICPFHIYIIIITSLLKTSKSLLVHVTKV
jgi:uracil phosphoribosyltransferase